MRFMSRIVETASDIDEWRRALRDQRARQILASGKQELRLSDLDFGRYWIEHTPTGNFFVAWTGDPSYAADAPAFYVTAAGEPVILNRADPASRDELEQNRLARAARRAAREATVKARNEERRRTLR